MKSLIKIKSIDKFRFFKQFRWNEELDCFDKYNIIYGWNGSGKSTLCDLMYYIEKNETLENEQKFQMLFQENHQPSISLNKTTISSEQHRFKVFHQSYADDLINKIDNIDHIYIIGVKEQEKVKLINALKQEQEKRQIDLTEIENKESDTEKYFESYRRELAKLIRSYTNYNQSYNYNEVYSRYKKMKDLRILEQEEVKRLEKSIKSIYKDKIDLLKEDFISKEVKKYIIDVLNQTPVHNTIERLKEDITLRDWVKEGYELHQNREKRMCEFCGNEISEKLWKEYEGYFNDSLNKFNKKIDGTIRNIENYKNNIISFKNGLPHEAQFYKELEVDYISLRDKLKPICNKYENFFLSTIDILKRKKNFENNEELIKEFEIAYAFLDFDFSMFTDITKIIKEHNRKSVDFEKRIKEDKLKLESHFLADAKKLIEDYENKIKHAKENRVNCEKDLNELKTKIETLQNEVKNSRIPAEEINKDITFILGRDNLSFKWKETGYEIKRDKELAEKLSRGEKNAIALIYFFNSLLDSNVTLSESIVVLDDPISSFDSNYYFSSVAYIREKLEEVGQAFILTHKFPLYKDMKKMLTKARVYMLEREEGQPILKKESSFLINFEDEYSYLFKKIYDFVHNTPKDIQDYIMYPNIARRLLEGFLSFKMPETNCSDLLQKAIRMENGKSTKRIRAITRLLNNQSHLRNTCPIETVENVIDTKQLPEILSSLLDFIKEHDERHYNILEKQIIELSE